MSARSRKSPQESADLQQERARIERLVQEHNIDTVKLAATDIDGVWRGKRITTDYFLAAVLSEGTHICKILFGWDIQDTLIPNLPYVGWHTGYPDFGMAPDLSTFAVVPWEEHTASVICDFVEPDGSPVVLSPRYLLRQVVDRAASSGFVPKIGFELEFFLFRETIESARDKRFTGLRPLMPGRHTYDMHRLTMDEFIVGDIRRNMVKFGIQMEASNTEYGPGQIEINLHFTDAFTAADQVVLYKNAVKEIAASHGLIATFMAKIDADLVGSSGHIHQSLWNEEGGNLFFDPSADRGISKVARHYAAGLLATMREFTAFMCPTVNSYKRKVPLSWSATTATWGFENRTTGLRAISSGPKASRIEHRLPGADANPYIAIAACVAGGLYGLEQELEPSELLEGNAYDLEPDQVVVLPTTLDEAVEALDKSQLVRELLGTEFVEHFLATRRWELKCARLAVTDWERVRYFEMI